MTAEHSLGTDGSTGEVLRSLWAAEGDSREELDAACGHQKACRNMKHVSFDGMAEPGSDLRGAWRERLQREGKLATGAGTLRELVFPDGEVPAEPAHAGHHGHRHGTHHQHA